MKYQKTRDFYAAKPGAPLIMTEFGFYCLDKWKAEGHIGSADWGCLSGLFGFEDEGVAALFGLGGCEAAFLPCFGEEVLEDRGEHELVRDKAGRHVLCFKGQERIHAGIRRPPGKG